MKRTGILQHIWKSCALFCGVVWASPLWTDAEEDSQTDPVEEFEQFEEV
ncbi:MAG: hypothetical protein ACQR33_06010 [Candidatus Saccharibacteria bacterium]